MPSSAKIIGAVSNAAKDAMEALRAKNRFERVMDDSLISVTEIYTDSTDSAEDITTPR
jgi:hypothetical protein